METKWLFFDVGGVLADESIFNHWIQRQIVQIIRKYNSEISLEMIKAAKPIASSMKGKLSVNTMSLFLQGKQLEEAAGDLRKIRDKNPTREELEVVRPEAAEVVKAMARKYSLGIIANQHKEIKAKLDKSGVLQYFKLTDVSEDYNLLKPDPLFFKTVLARAGVEPRHSVMIDDNIERSLHVAKQLGMTTVWYKLEERAIPLNTIDHTITSLRDLLPLF